MFFSFKSLAKIKLNVLNTWLEKGELFKAGWGMEYRIYPKDSQRLRQSAPPLPTRYV